MVTRQPSKESSENSARLLEDKTTKKHHHAKKKSSKMYKIGFRQFNVGSATNEDRHSNPRADSDASHRALELNKLGHDDSNINPLKWYLAIQNDDTEEYDRIMANFPDSKLSIIQGKFIYQADTHLAQLAQELKAHCTYETSFILACAFGSKGIVEKMLDDGVDVRVRERSGVNFVHALIQAAAENREREKMLVNMYELIMTRVTEEVRRDVIFATDKEGYRPVELSVRRGIYGIFKEIMETEGVYKKTEPAGRLGLHTFLTYDITEYENYENRERELRSPMRLMNYMSDKHLNSYLKFDIHSMPIVKRWREQKIRSTMPIIIIWYIFKLLFISTVIFLDSSRLSFVRERANKSSTEKHALSLGSPALDDTMIVIMTVIGSAIVVVVTILNIRQILDVRRREVDSHVSHGTYLIHTSFYTYVQIIMCTLVIVQFIMAYAHASQESIYGVKAVLIPFGLLSYLQIFIVIPYINRFVIALQRMVVVLMKFVVIHITVRLVFCLFLMNTEHDHPDQNFNNFNDAFYGIFLLDLSEIQLEPPFYLQFTHLAFFYISGVLLINYLIAVMSDLAAEVNQYGVIICDLTKLELAYQAQENFGRYLWAWTDPPIAHMIVKVEESKGITQDELLTPNVIDPEKYDIDN